jgi:hypothetical protein
MDQARAVVYDLCVADTEARLGMVENMDKILCGKPAHNRYNGGDYCDEHFKSILDSLGWDDLNYRRLYESLCLRYVWGEHLTCQLELSTAENNFVDK